MNERCKLAQQQTHSSCFGLSPFSAESQIMIRTLFGIAVFSQFAVSCFSQTGTDFQVPTVSENVAKAPFPRIAVTDLELHRLRGALEGNDEWAKRVVAEKIRAADKALGRKLTFPPSGGQHNQWYQCQDCQLALQTQDATHHQCPQCKRVYSGEPYDDVIYSRMHRENLKAALAAAWAHALTGKTKYAEYAAKVLTGYAERYRRYPYHTSRREKNPGRKKYGGHLFEQTLTEASAFATYIAPAYDLVCASGVLTTEQDQAIQQGLLRPMIANIEKYKVGKSNWQTWHNAAMIAGGGVLGDASLIQRAISDPRNGFVDQMNVSVSADGMWYENSWAYHFYTLRAMIQIAEYARRMQIDLWSHPRLQSMFSIAPDYAMPGGLLPRFGDDVNSRVASAKDSLEFAHHANPDIALEPFLNPRPTWDSVLLGRTTTGGNGGETKPQPKLFPAAGHAILRTDKPKNLSSVMTFGPYGGFHGHFDKLSFVFFGLGKELGVDPGRARSQAYRLPVHKNWYKATLSHNTVVVDKKSQAPAAGELLLFDSSDKYNAAMARCTSAYPGVEHTRLLLQTDEYLLIFDDLQADSNRRFDWYYHNRGRTVQCDVADATVTRLDKDYVGLEFIKNAQTGTTSGATRATFDLQTLQMELTLDAARNTQVLIGDGVGSSVLERVPLIRVTRRGTSARFAAVLEPVLRGEQPQVDSVNWIEQADGSILIHVKGNQVNDRIGLAPDRKNVSFNE